jgi:starch-binding outer membrane protein, SusD/RagB family
LTKMKFCNKIFKAALLAYLFTGCISEEILNERPPHLITTETLYTSYAGFETGVNSLYSRVRLESSGGNGHRSETFKTGTDVLTANSAIREGGFSLIAQEWGSLLNPNHGYIYDLFAWLYSVVNGANTIITQSEKPDIDWSGGVGTPEENKNLILAEARAIRAWAYRHLTFGWGDVPLSLEESLGSTIRTDWERTPVAEVRNQILADLLFAEPHIPIEPQLRGRLTKGAVQHYLSEMYLTLGDPGNALIWADKVINTPQYRLITERYGVRANRPGVPFADMFYDGNSNRDQGNTEALWVFQYERGVPGGGGSSRRRIHLSRYADWVVNGVRPLQNTVERGGRGGTRCSLTNYFMNELFEPQDDRFSQYSVRTFFILKDAEANAPYAADRLPPGYNYGDTLWVDWTEDLSPTNLVNVNRPFLRKMEGAYAENPDDAGDQYNDEPYLRLAETYMLKAEAEYLLGRPEDAAETLNVIRRRSNASEISADVVNIDFILDERARELTMEEHRRWTLIRTGKWIERTRAHNKNGGQFITERDLLFPIPQAVIDANLTGIMSQNPGF